MCVVFLLLETSNPDVSELSAIALVKLFMKFVKGEKVIWLMGTAWLIRSDLLVTAGHNVYDWEYNLGRAREIKASLGYWGEDSVDNTVQFRYGTMVATSSGWLATKDNRINDVAFIKLDRAFDGTDTEMNLFHFKATPVSGERRMGIVGYPGQSGSPVLLDDYNTSIGTHVNGDFFENSASPIAGEYGNLYHAYIRAIDGHYTPVKRKDEVEYVRVTIPNDPERPYEAAEESLITVGGNVNSNILKLGSPFLGPIGGPIAALAATCVLFAGGVCESALDPEGSVSGSDITAYAHHAILAEAAIQATNRLSREALNKLNFEENVREEYSTLASQVYGIGSKLFPVLMESALRLALEAYHISESGQQSTPSAEAESLPKLGTLQYTKEGSNQDSQTEAFIDSLLQNFWPTQGEERFFDQLGSVIVNGLRTSKTIQTMAPTGLCLLSSLLAPTQSRSQSTELDIYFEDLLDRALMAEATLRAIIFAKKTVRSQTVSISEDEKKAVLQREGFYDLLKAGVQGIGRKVIESTPSVISKLQPLLMELLSPNKATKQLDIPIPGNPTQDLETNLAFARKSVRLPEGPVVQRSTRLGAVASRYGNNHNLDGPSVAFSSLS
ncbi:unnamed protein product [Aspergillus oryzae]|uniref:Unnamed protein product n=2 Tax=Aspergillus oryzae TaxID=5062 RepID=A0AAN5BN98_ASPOZ|nr:unnamed protein product [Aspergillus oryzae]GMF87948.1 unnamed protein product [Aspergillus oryzae]GMG06449.1 unnamed protein product [Aspergillus oryzae]GMG24286.1 unnamed protein product [Aspergillus oryzae]GMG47565.1 unnamed protein product [Aspergillus oryzae var. brunneus]